MELIPPFIKKIIHSVKINIGECLLCSNPCQHLSNLCDDCWQDLPLFHHDQVDLLQQPKIASRISHQYFDHLFCLAPHQWPFDFWIKQLKYHQQFELATLLANLLSKHIKYAIPNINSDSNGLISVPIHIKRWRERGYNQSHLIAKQLAKKIAITYLNDVLIRDKHTEKQVGKDGIERRKNLKNAFKLIKPITKNIEHVFLFDDVITTGTTVNEVAKLLKKSGVSTITVVTISIAINKI